MMSSIAINLLLSISTARSVIRIAKNCYPCRTKHHSLTPKLLPLIISYNESSALSSYRALCSPWAISGLPPPLPPAKGGPHASKGLRFVRPVNLWLPSQPLLPVYSFTEAEEENCRRPRPSLTLSDNSLQVLESRAVNHMGD